MGKSSVKAVSMEDYDGGEEDQEFIQAHVQWTSSDGLVFVPARRTVHKLPPGVYEVDRDSQIGLFFEKIPVKTEGLLKFPETNSDAVLEEIQKFWDREELFTEYGLTYKRGILLYGPPGAGKSCTLQLIIQDVVRRKGVVLCFDDPYLFVDGLRVLRQIQPNTPVVATMEDIDSLIQEHSETEILNILDGVNQLHKVVFLATTNYPEKLGARIVNRPSRFDKRFRIGYPSAKSRRLYLEALIGKGNIKKLKVDLDRWVKDTDEMTIAHLKELFVAVVILGDDYSDALRTLKKMTETLNDQEFENQLGFGSPQKTDNFYG